jgi:2-hydroxy-3-keto-5-methylthiopentenyl-1-phosphate phosphatase
VTGEAIRVAAGPAVREPVDLMAAPRIPVRSIVVDFDGTICPVDVSDAIMDAFVGPLARELDLEYERGEIGSRENLVRIGSRIDAGPGEVLSWALAHHRVDPTFPVFVEWSRSVGLELTVVSDGLGLHVEPMLEAAGVFGLPVISNRFAAGRGPARLEFPAGHPECRECGTCKMLAVTSIRRLGPVAYAGDGHSDRYGALYSDLVFAKGHLVVLCRSGGIPFVPWATFDDVREKLEEMEPSDLPGPVNPKRCPGWR